jgi:hypothetical protein
MGTDYLALSKVEVIGMRGRKPHSSVIMEDDIEEHFKVLDKYIFFPRRIVKKSYLQSAEPKLLSACVLH